MDATRYACEDFLSLFLAVAAAVVSSIIINVAVVSWFYVDHDVFCDTYDVGEDKLRSGMLRANA